MGEFYSEAVFLLAEKSLPHLLSASPIRSQFMWTENASQWNQCPSDSFDERKRIEFKYPNSIDTKYAFIGTETNPWVLWIFQSAPYLNQFQKLVHSITVAGSIWFVLGSLLVCKAINSIRWNVWHDSLGASEVVGIQFEDIGANRMKACDYMCYQWHWIGNQSIFGGDIIRINYFESMCMRHDLYCNVIEI